MAYEVWCIFSIIYCIQGERNSVKYSYIQVNEIETHLWGLAEA